MSKPSKKVQAVFDYLHHIDKRYELKNGGLEWYIHLKQSEIDVEISVFNHHKGIINGAVYFSKSRILRGTQVYQVTFNQLESVIMYGIQLIESGNFNEKTDRHSYFDGGYGFRKVR